MRCDKAQKLMSFWLDGMLARKDERTLLAHLKSCKHCQQVLHDWEQIRETLRLYPSITPSPEFDRKVLSRIKTPRATAPPITSQWLTNPVLRIASSAMGGLVIMVLTLLMLMPLIQEPSKQREQIPYWQRGGFGSEVVRWLDNDLGGELRWRSSLPSTPSLSSSRSLRC